MSDLAIGLCWTGAIIAFVIFDIFVYKYAKIRQEKQDAERAEFMKEVAEQEAKLIAQGYWKDECGVLHHPDEPKPTE